MKGKFHERCFLTEIWGALADLSRVLPQEMGVGRYRRIRIHNSAGFARFGRGVGFPNGSSNDGSKRSENAEPRCVPHNETTGKTLTTRQERDSPLGSRQRSKLDFTMGILKCQENKERGPAVWKAQQTAGLSLKPDKPTT